VTLVRLGAKVVAVWRRLRLHGDPANQTVRLVAPLAMCACLLAPAPSVAAGVPGHPRATTVPKPVAVYVGRQLVAAGQSLSSAIGKVRTQVPFTVRTPRYVPAGYRPVQLTITPRQRDVSLGFSTLSYVLWRHGQASTSIGFEINQAPHAIPVVGGTRVTTIKIGPAPATLHQFTAAHQDIVILTWLDSQGNGYDLVTNATVSGLLPHTIARIAASLR
jgi:hypothetical protein